MKRINISFLIVFLLSLSFAKAQTTILIYNEDFENGAPGVTLNTSGAGGNYGKNQWVINDKYDGAPLYQNTPDENQTVSGTISKAPYSHYLHIYDTKADSTNSISNCNYNPTDSSDRFAQLTFSSIGFCTLGITNVKIAFFYLGMGSGTAYAELYYSANNGPWTQTGTIYNNQPIWKYELIQNPAFDNKVNLRFGFRWVNKSGSLPGNSSIGIDDIFVKGDFDNFAANFNLKIDSIKPIPVCQNFSLSLYYHLTAPICGVGFCQVELSDSTGSFAKPKQLEIYPINNQRMSGTLYPTIPASTPPGKCYKIRIQYYYSYYGLDFYTTATICFEVKHCPNTVTTLKALMITKPDSICVGSVIDVPFFSTGVFLKNNKYIAELSDSLGNFPPKPNVLGTSPDQNTYDPATGALPGSVSGLINENNQPIPNGCNYYIRVNSTAPPTIGMVYGPFCIKHCDIETNRKKDIQVCLHSCKTSAEGFNTIVNIKIHDFDSTAVYAKNNKFLIELREPQFFGVVSFGGIGTITASNDTTLLVHLPCADSLGYVGLSPGLYYMRMIATNSNHPLNMNGTLIRLIIGAPSDDLSILQDPPDSVLCVGDVVYFYPMPWNAGPPMNSTYQWFLNGKLFLSNPAIGIIFNGAGTYNLTLQETNYGCKGPQTPNSTKLYVLGPPNTLITGPYQTCLGDTLHYQVPFEKGVYYEWSSVSGSIIDTSNNLLNILYDAEGVYVVKVLALNKCGQALGNRNVIVTKHPEATFSFDTPICSEAPSIIKATGTSPPPLSYRWNFDGGLAVPEGNKPGPYNVTWKNAGKRNVVLTVTKNGCSTKDSNIVDVLQKPTAFFSYKNLCFGTPCEFKDSTQTNPSSWIWDFGDDSLATASGNPAHLYAAPGSYPVQLIVTSSNGCKDTLVKVVPIHPVPTSDFVAKTPICNGESSVISYTGNAPADAVYTWNFSNGEVISGTGPGPYEITWSGLGEYNIELYVSKNNCYSKTDDSVTVRNCVVKDYNIITPKNKDGFNSTFKFKGLEDFQGSRLLIFNRWGNKIYESVDYKNDWDGGNHPEGAYFYILTLSDGTFLKGTVTILK